MASGGVSDDLAFKDAGCGRSEIAVIETGVIGEEAIGIAVIVTAAVGAVIAG